MMNNGSNVWIVCFLMYLCLLATVHSFDLQKFCSRRCAVGQGGNLCRCTAHHFAGKRSETHAAEVAAAETADETNMDAEGQTRRSHGGSTLNNNEKQAGIDGVLDEPSDLRLLSMSDGDDLLTNNRMFYPLMGVLPEGSRRANLVDRLPVDEGLFENESDRIKASLNDKDISQSSLNLLAKRYRRYNQQSAAGVPSSYKRISPSENSAQLKEVLEKAIDNKTNQRILKLILSKISR